jgi:hypothetical protein
MAIAEVPTAPLPVLRGRLNPLSDNAFRAATISHRTLQKYVSKSLEFEHTFE